MFRLVFLQLAIWVTAIHAFYPWFPSSLCGEDKSCEHKESRRHAVRGMVASAEARRRTAAGHGVAFELSQRIPHARQPLRTRVSKSAEHLSTKYSRHASTWSLRRARRDNKFPVVTAAAPSATNAAGISQDGRDVSYFVQASFGSHPQPLYMLLDTGAGTTWVMDAACKSEACAMHSVYKSADSNTFKGTPEAFEINYGSGKVAGNLASDSIAIAGMKTTMSFGVANTTSDDFTNFAFDGILGMSTSKGATDNFMEAVKSGKLLPANMFSVAVSRNSDGPNAGEIMFGATNPAKFTGDISYTPVSGGGKGDWAIPMDDMEYDGKKAGVTGRLAYIDTGTTFAFGPKDDVAAVHKQIPGATSSDGVTYTAPCDSDKALNIAFSGVSYTISPKDWLSEPSSAGTCTSNLYGHEVVTGSWLLGDILLKNVYAVFDLDQSRIGFANRPASTSQKSSGAGGPTSSGSAASVTPTTGSDMGLGGHETSATVAAESATATHSSPGEQLESSKYVSIMVLVVAIAMAA